MEWQHQTFMEMLRKPSSSPNCFFLSVIQVYISGCSQRVSHYLAQHNKTPTTIKRMTEAEAVDPLFLILEAERKLREQSFKSPLTA